MLNNYCFEYILLKISDWLIFKFFSIFSVRAYVFYTPYPPIFCGFQSWRWDPAVLTTIHMPNWHFSSCLRSNFQNHHICHIKDNCSKVYEYYCYRCSCFKFCWYFTYFKILRSNPIQIIIFFMNNITQKSKKLKFKVWYNLNKHSRLSKRGVFIIFNFLKLTSCPYLRL